MQKHLKILQKIKKKLCISADLDSSSTIDGFRDRYPHKFISMGMAEQNMMSFSGGPRFSWI